MPLAGISTTVHSNQKSRSLKKPLENGQLFVAHFEISNCTDKLRSRTNLGASQKGPKPGLEPFVLADRAMLVLQFLLTSVAHRGQFQPAAEDVQVPSIFFRENTEKIFQRKANIARYF